MGAILVNIAFNINHEGLIIFVALESQGTKSVDFDLLHSQCSDLRQKIEGTPIFQIKQKMTMFFEFSPRLQARVVMKAQGVKGTQKVREALSAMKIRSLF